MLLTVPRNEGHRSAAVQQSNRGFHLLSGQVKLTGNMGNLDINHGRQFCILSARIVSCCLIEKCYPEKCYPNFSTCGPLSRVNYICRFALTPAFHGVSVWTHLQYYNDGLSHRVGNASDRTGCHNRRTAGVITPAK